MYRTLVYIVLIFTTAVCVFGQTTKDVVSTREMDRINWMEFRDTVPSKIKTVLLPVGTLEPHGVINNGADNTAPTAMAKDYRAKSKCDDRADFALRNDRKYGRVSGARFRFPKPLIARSSNKF
jgi:hypothetical protein